jgi:hypothetical protein
MTDFEFTRGADPVPAEVRKADPDRDRQARDLERVVSADIHVKYDYPLDQEEPEWDQRVRYISYPAELAPPQRHRHIPEDEALAGFIYWQAGAWFWRPHWGSVDDPSLDPGLDRIPSIELEVETEEEAIQHARRRVAWEVAGRETDA